MEKVRKILFKRVLTTVLVFAMLTATTPMNVVAEIDDTTDGKSVVEIVEETAEKENVETSEVMEETTLQETAETLEEVTGTTENTILNTEDDFDEEQHIAEMYGEITENVEAEPVDEVNPEGGMEITPSYAKVYTDVPADIAGNGTENVVVNISEARLEWRDDINGGYDGWGIVFEVVRDAGSTVTGRYDVNSNYMTEGISGDAGVVTEIWMPVTPEYLKTARDNGTFLQMNANFIWNDSQMVQRIEAIIHPSDNIVLSKQGVQVYPALYNINIQQSSGLGNVFVNNVPGESFSFTEGTQTMVKMVAEEGYVIKSIKIDGEELQGISVGATEYTIQELDMNADKSIEVEYARLLEITCEKSGNGELEINPSIVQDEKIFLIEGTQVTITGRPAEGHYIESVRWNDSEEPHDGATYSKTIAEVSEGFKIEISFLPYMYNFTAIQPDHGSIVLPDGQVAYGSNIQIELRPDDGYTVDYLKANGENVEVSKNSFGAYIAEFLKVTQDFELSAGFKEIAYAEAPYFTIDTSKVLRSNADESLYVIGNEEDSCVTFATNQIGIILQTADGEYLGGWSTPEVAVSKACTITDILVCYKHPDEWFPELHRVEVGHKEIVKDETKAKASLNIITQPNKHGVYRNDVQVGYWISDDREEFDWQTGIRKVEYSFIDADNENTILSTHVLYSYDEGQQGDIVYEIENDNNNCIIVQPQSVDTVRVRLVVTDQAGNVTTINSGKIKFSTTAPKVKVSISGDQNEGMEETNFYCTSRELKITLTDSKNGYNEENAKKALKVSKNGNAAKEMLPETISRNDDEYTFTYIFADPGHYIWEYSYENNGGYLNTALDTSGCKDVYDFYVDGQKPRITVSYNNNSCKNDSFFDDSRTATIQIVEHHFDVGATKVYVDNEEKSDLKWNAHPTEANTYIATYTFDQEGNHSFSAECTDLAGNVCSESDVGVKEGTKSPWEFTIDKSNPHTLITYLSEPVTANAMDGYVFYNTEEIEVIIQAIDDVSGIDYLQYSYVAQDGASNSNEEKNVIVSNEDLIKGTDNKYSTTIKIPAQFRGIVSFTAYDKAGRETGHTDSIVRVVDNKRPEVSVSYSYNDVSNGRFYREKREATITIKEDNFFEQDLQDELLDIQITKDGKEVDVKNTLKFAYNTKKEVYEAKYKFVDDAEYTFDIAYTDRAGNSAADYSKDSFVIDKTKPVIEIEKANGAFLAGARTVTVAVSEKNFAPKDFIFVVSAKDINGNEIDLPDGNYAGYTDYAEYLKDANNWEPIDDGQKWLAQLTFAIEGQYNITANYTDLAGNPAAEYKDTFCIDTSAPEKPELQYKPQFSAGEINNQPFGFLQAGDSVVKVNVSAADKYAGISHFIYSYEVEEGASNVNSGMKDVRVEANSEDGKETAIATASFEIPAQFRGHLTVVAVDRAGNDSTLVEERTLIVDSINPEIKVSYDNNTVANEVYYNGDRTATITITEANFFGTSEWAKADLTDGNLSISVTAVDNAGNSSTTSLEPDFVKETESDIYKANIPFTGDGDYTLKVSYKDRSGNESVSKIDDSFTIDKTAPTIKVEFDNNDVRNEKYFNKARIATITVTEHNFDPDLVDISVTKSSGQDEAYVDYPVEKSDWTHKGDSHEIVLLFTEEGNYTFNIACKDKADIDNQDVDYGTSQAPNKFTIDTSAPDAEQMEMLIGNESVKGKETTFAFDTFYKEAVNIKLSADCDISGVSSLLYQKVSKLTDYTEDDNWSEYDEKNGITIAPSDKCIIFFKAEDKAGNSTIVRSTGIIVDNKEPSGERNAPEIDIIPAAPNGNGYYAGNVHVDLKVVDPKYRGEVKNDAGFYSGLKEITGKIYTTDTSAVETFELFRAASNSVEADEDGLVPSWSGNIVIDSENFNSNNVIVEITATDNAGNTRTTKTKAGLIQIDTTAPLVDISYNNNSAVNEKIFNADRIATIVVTERNFRPEDMKIVLTNSDGTVPGLSAWSKTAGTGNLDDTRWTATLHYSEDGDYVFNATYADAAGNACKEVRYLNSVAPNEFTIDKTIPVIAVRYDNNSARNGFYYNENRVAVIDITEHNFRPEDVMITMTASDDGQAISLPAISNWSTTGDRHTATIRYENDGKYTFDIAMNDMAGNVAADYVEDSFVVDKTVPVLSIAGVSDNSANSGAVVPVITYSDTNYDEQQVVISLIGANRKSVVPDGSYADIHNGRVFTFKDFAYEKEIDDIYTLSVTITDKAGNVSSETLSFSVNRFGSNYVLDKEVEEMNGKYIQDPKDIVVKEVNANELTVIKITMYKNNETVVLEEGKDYSVKVEGGNGKWYEYTYTIFADNFAEDGIYRFAFYSEDGAGNVAENTLDTKNTEISMGVDRTKPNIIMVNLESDETYAVENLTVYMTVSDNLLLQSVKLYLDDYNKEYKVWEGEELENILAGNGEFTFNVSGDSKRAHKAKIVCCDAAGNEQVEEITDFFVTTDILVRYFNNKPLFFGSIGGAVLLVGLVIFLIVYRRKKDEM